MATQRRSAGAPKKPAAKKKAPPARAKKPAAKASPKKPAAGGRDSLTVDPKTGLTTVERAFCEAYMLDRRGGHAYRSIFPGVQNNSARTEAWRILQRPAVVAFLEARRTEHIRSLSIDRDRLIGELVAIATADPNELVEYRREACPKCWDVAGMAMPNEECTACRGEGVGVTHVNDTRFLSPKGRALFAGIKETRDGIQVLMRDQDGAIDRLARILGVFKADNEQKAQPLAEAVAQLVGEIHGMGGARLPIAAERK
jgi:phage terminase small subunit